MLKKPSFGGDYALGIDIGGSKIRAHLYQIDGSQILNKPVWPEHEGKEPSQKGIDAHVAQVAGIVRAAAGWVKQKDGKLAAIGIGSPGRFDAGGRIKAGSNENLASFPGEFNGKNLRALYREALRGDPALPLESLQVSNDADLMLAGMIDAIANDMLEIRKKGRGGEIYDQNGAPFLKKDLRSRYVALFGIGTGVGHAIMKPFCPGGHAFVTDGHASKLRVKVDDADWPVVLEMKKLRNLPGGIVDFADHSVRAEDLFRTPVICGLAGLTKASEFSVENGKVMDAGQEKLLRFAGKYMARLIVLIRSGQSEDVTPENGWTDVEKAEAAKTSVYLIGSGMGRSEAGGVIIRYAADELARLASTEEFKDKNLDSIRLVQYTGKNVAAYTAAKLAAEPMLSRGRAM